ncbi:MAG: DUF4132 domain-containing protein, partial [Muribaculaceae bacterium]|nr:DUF4132 domain-containing protein [Muribaculaceae bacterium]
MTDEIKNLIKKFFCYVDPDSREKDNFETLLIAYALRHNIEDVVKLFEGELEALPLFLLGEQWSKLWSIFMNLEVKCPYTVGYSRRSVRSRRVSLHAQNIAVALKEFMILRATGFSAVEILRQGRTPEEAKDLKYSFPNISNWLASMIMSGDKTCIGYITDAMLSENNANRLSHDMFRAIVKSGDRQLLETEGKLLLAARLQEGLRQAIVETMDEGAPESFIYLLNVIRENNLQRFASVKRGMAVATGLGETEAPERITDKFFEYVALFLENREIALEGIESEDAILVYLGLWSIAFFNVDDLRNPISGLIEKAPSYKVDAAMIVLSLLQDPILCSSMVSDALHKRHRDHDIMAGAIPMYLNSYELHIEWYYGDPAPMPPLDRYFKSKEDAEKDFDILCSLLSSMKGKETFYPYVFPWLALTLSKGEIADRLVKIALLLDSQEYIDIVIDFVGYMEPYERAGAIKYLLQHPNSEKIINFAVSSMGDRGEHARDVACKAVERLHLMGRLTCTHYSAMEDLLRLKASDMRVSIISILSSLPDKEAYACALRLLDNKSADRRLAALDMIKNWMDKGEKTAYVEALIPAMKEIKRPTTKEKVLIANIIDATKSSVSAYNLSNGFGLYNPDEDLHLKPSRPENFVIEKALSFSEKRRAEDIMLKIMKIIEDNADFEFTNSDGDTVLLGNTPKVNRYRNSLDALAKPDMWKEFYEREINSPTDLLKLDLAIGKYEDYDSPFFPLFRRLLGNAFHEGTPMKEISGFPYYDQAYEVCKCLIYEYSSAPETWELCADVFSEIVTTVSPEDMIHRYTASYSSYFYEIDNKDHAIFNVWPFSRMMNILKENSLKCDDDLFVYSFRARYALYRLLGYRVCFNPVSPAEYLRLWDIGLITDNEFWHEMLGREDSANMVNAMTKLLPEAPVRARWQYDRSKLNSEECDLVNKAIDRILEIELLRGDTPTVVSKLAHRIIVVVGIDYFIRLIVGMGKEKPTSNFWNFGESKREIFSWLLHVSCPASGDTASELKKLAAEAEISDERLVEAAMFSPRWLGLVESAIGWKGLASAAYYFMAHTGEHLDDISKSHISRYTSVAPEDFADGAFDPIWFKEVYRLLGKKRFEVVYDAAKYISEGNRHTRSRKLSDAALGILKAKEVQKEIEEKRNKDFVVAYGLIPLGKNRTKDLRQRYETLNKFLKESKQFGSMRQTSEGRAVKLALDNLARTAGFGDSTRLTWSMEADLVEEVAEFLLPKEVDGVMVYIELCDGIPTLVAESKGKRLQSLPSRLKKDKYVERMREVYKQLKDQHVRGRALLETSMVDCSVFTGEEVFRLKDNPIIWSLFSRLVIVKDTGELGFPGEDGKSLIAADGVMIEILPDDKIRIAHPLDLLDAGVWNEYQSFLFDRQWRQPFKQVFRELYVPTVEEMEKSKSMRYSGNQIMPARAVGVLKKRQWTVDYENGLQKVCFNGDVIAVMYALADWFSPADIEAPTLEYVAFFDRRTFKDKKIEDIPPIVFSEIMRDVDLAVSVAHAGGVDPETSHSTIEMRRAIVSHAMPMFGISNFEVVGNFAKVKGKLGNYNIHLGSGVIHKEGGAQIAVLPVHSQGRGRIFLPFLDEDPKTAEIISKILLFAEDHKIKDPSIL